MEGLAAACSLALAGHRVRVFEQTPELGEVGAGIQVSANGNKVLDSIGVSAKLEAHAVRPAAYVFRLFDSGETLQQFSLSEHEEKHGAPYLQLHRADLHKALVERFNEIAPGATHLDHELTSFDETEDGVTAHFANGSSIQGDLLIGADGIKSAVRKGILGESPAQYTGQAVWRILVPASRLPEGFVDKVMSVWVGPGRHAVIYYVRSAELINCVACVDSPDWRDDSWLAKADWSDMRADFGDWNEEVTGIIDAADKGEVYRWALYNRPPAVNWSSERATLLGDSCHATLPYLAQGAVMAIEDAAVLRRALDQEASITEALQLYQRNRIERTSRIVAESSDNARLFHLPDEETLRAEFATRELGRERNNWLYSYDPLTVPLV